VESRNVAVRKQKFPVSGISLLPVNITEHSSYGFTDRQGTLYKFGCFLPISQNTSQIDRQTDRQADRQTDTLHKFKKIKIMHIMKNWVLLI
jgi:hypothetical protein